MKVNVVIKIAVDIIMTVTLLLLMAFELIGRAEHEWLGIGMVALFLVHHFLNRKWSKAVFRGRYTMMRTLQTVLAVAILFTILGSAYSGIVLSRHTFRWLELPGSRSIARTLHMFSAYWGFVLMSLHIGIHWKMIIGIAGKHFSFNNKKITVLLRCIGCAVACCGVYAFICRNIGNYMLLKTQFVIFDFEEPIYLFFTDYFAVMWMFVFVGHYLSKGLLEIRKKG